jgi:hypothetical protein
MNLRSAYVGCWMLVLIGLSLDLGGCATPADPEKMVVASETSAPAFPERWQHAMCVRSVVGGEETNPLWISKVGNDQFRIALASSLDGAGLTAPSGACKYPVDVSLLGLSQPASGFDMTVTSHVNYKVYDTAGQPVLLETISAAYTAPVGFDTGVARLRKANEGSMRASIEQFFDKLRTAAR